MYLEQKFVWLSQLALLLSTAVLSELCDVESERVTVANSADVIRFVLRRMEERRQKEILIQRSPLKLKPKHL